MLQAIKNFFQSKLMIYSPAGESTYTVVPEVPKHKDVLAKNLRPGMVTTRSVRNRYNQFTKHSAVITDVLVHNKKNKSKGYDKGVDIRIKFEDGSFETLKYGSNQLFKIEVK